MGTSPRQPRSDIEHKLPNLRRLRVAQGWTREQLAAQLSPARAGAHLNVRTLDRWEAGDTPIPQRYWSELSNLFGVSVSHLMGWDDAPGNGGTHEAVA